MTKPIICVFEGFPYAWNRGVEASGGDEVQPRVQRRIVAEYRQGVRGYGYIATAKRLQLPVSMVKGVIARAKWACCESEQPALQPGGERSIRGAWRVDQVLASEGQVF